MEIALQLLALILLEIILGVDNLIINSVLADRLPAEKRALARRIGLVSAMALRLALLFTIDWLLGLDETLIHLGRLDLTGKDLLLIGGGAFLIYQSGSALIELRSGTIDGDVDTLPATASWSQVLGQMMLMNLVFSLDAVITAIGVTDHLWVMVVAIVSSVAVMLLAAEPIIRLVVAYPTVKSAALAILLLIGSVLLLEGIGLGVPKWVVYLIVIGLLGYAGSSVLRENRAKTIVTDAP